MEHHKHPSSRFREIKRLEKVSSNLLYQYNREFLSTFLSHPEYAFILRFFLRRISKVLEVNGVMDHYLSVH